MGGFRKRTRLPDELQGVAPPILPKIPVMYGNPYQLLVHSIAIVLLVLFPLVPDSFLLLTYLLFPSPYCPLLPSPSLSSSSSYRPFFPFFSFFPSTLFLRYFPSLSLHHSSPTSPLLFPHPTLITHSPVSSPSVSTELPQLSYSIAG